MFTSTFKLSYQLVDGRTSLGRVRLILVMSKCNYFYAVHMSHDHYTLLACVQVHQFEVHVTLFTVNSNNKVNDALTQLK